MMMMMNPEKPVAGRKCEKFLNSFESPCWNLNVYVREKAVTIFFSAVKKRITPHEGVLENTAHSFFLSLTHTHTALADPVRSYPNSDFQLCFFKLKTG